MSYIISYINDHWLPVEHRGSTLEGILAAIKANYADRFPEYVALRTQYYEIDSRLHEMEEDHEVTYFLPPSEYTEIQNGKIEDVEREAMVVRARLRPHNEAISLLTSPVATEFNIRVRAYMASEAGRDAREIYENSVLSSP